MFDKIVTISLNPALDVTLWISTMDFSEPNQAMREKTYAAGKPVNVARVLNSLQTPSMALGICGDDNAGLFFSLLRQDGVPFHFQTVPGSIRENLTLVVPDGRALKINRSGVSVTSEAMAWLKDRIEEEIEGCDRVLLVFAGSLPPNLTPEKYRAFILSFRRDGISLALDTSVFTLDEIRDIRPFVIKPNRVEFCQMCGDQLQTQADLVRFARSLIPDVTHVLVSLGADGLIYAGSGGSSWLRTPPLKATSTVGAGDTTLAGFIHALQQGKTPLSAAAYAVAAGSASVLLDGTEVITSKQVEDQLQQVDVQSI